jgi:hypothetical protein
VKLLYIFIVAILFEFSSVYGQNDWRKTKLKVPPTICYASDKVEKSFIPPPPEILLKAGAEKKSDIIVSYNLFPADAKAAFEYAVNIWEYLVESDVPIYVEARWKSMNTNTLGSAGPTDYYANFDNAPRKNCYYPVCIVEKITKSEISGSSSPDISATFNKDIKWYFGTDGQTPALLYDFVTVVLHEIGHGLGFTGFLYTTGNVGAYGNENAGDVSAFDIMVVNNNNLMLTDTSFFSMPSTFLFNALTSDLLYSSSPVATTNNSGNKPRLYAPSAWDDGSSIYHLNDATYPYSNENSLMTHAIGKGEAVHDPGPITKGILADIGWKLMKLNFDKPKDIEKRQPILFNLSIESDFEINTNSVFVYYSTDAFKNNKDSMLMTYNNALELFSASINPGFDTKRIDYYVSASDNMNRTFSVPSEAPFEIYSVNIGPDNTAPEINHIPIPYFVSNGDNMMVTAKVIDNLGIDTVFVDFSVNDIPQQSFGLLLDSVDIYSGIFNIDAKLLNDGDIISYKITAIDNSKALNKTISPAKDYFSFKVEKIFEPIGGYFNDFNTPTSDFILSDFDVYVAVNFKNQSLHSPHPYPSPDKNNSEFNFTTLLKYPIILQQNGTMSFDEIVLVEPGEVLSKFGDDDFWDYVIIEGSKDNGKTWLPLVNGYDSGDNTTWKTNYNKNVDNNQVSTAVGIPDWYVTRNINLLENGNFKANDTILIQFRLFSDPFAHGWGWAIDNLRIQSPLSASSLILSPGNISVYPNPFNDKLKITVQAGSEIEDLTIEILSLYGQTITTLQNKNVLGQITIEPDLSKLAVGMYFVIVKENGKMVKSQKIIKN